MMIRHKGSVAAVVVLAALVSGGWFLQRETEPAGSVYQQARLFDDVLAHVADYYVDSLDERQLYQMAIEGMLDQLHDPYSVFLKPEDFRQLSEATTGNYSGLGIHIDVRVGYVALSPVSESSTRDVSQAIDTLLKQGMKSLIFDLRGNPGGLLDQGVAVSDLFLDPGKAIVETRGRAPGSSHEFSDAKPQL